MTMINNRILGLFAAVLTAALLVASPVMAGGPTDWGIMMQDAASSSADRIHNFHDMMMVIITVITLFVLLLLIIVVVRYNRHTNKKPSDVTHNVLLEIIWTVVPVVILIVVAVPSFKLLYQNDRFAEPEMTLKVRGYQWYWGYEYPDQGEIAFSSYMVQEDDLKADQKRLLSTDNVVVLPVDTNISILISAEDVIHSWAVPALGVKTDAVPGRTNETWFNISKPGVYYGQCSEICGKDHAFMPIEIWAVPKDVFETWVEQAKEDIDNANIRNLISVDELKGMEG